MRTIAFLATKGGVAKTTTTVNLASAMHRAGKRVLVVDLDLQGSAGEYLLRASFEDTAADWLGHPGTETLPASMCTYEARNGEAPGYGLIHVIPGSPALIQVDQDMRGGEKGPWDLKRLARLLPEVEDDYDYCLLDCARSAGPIEVAAMVAADLIVTPATLEPASSVGIRHIKALAEQWARVFEFPPVLVLPTKLDGRASASGRMLEDMETKFGRWPEGQVLPPVRYAAAYVNSFYEQKTVYELEGSSAARAVKDTDTLWHIIRDFDYGTR
jgi:chromosome partitioning protein